MRRAAAARAGANLEVLAGLGHWWMIQASQPASLLQRFCIMAGQPVAEQEPSR